MHFRLAYDCRQGPARESGLGSPPTAMGTCPISTPFRTRSGRNEVWPGNRSEPSYGNGLAQVRINVGTGSIPVYGAQERTRTFTSCGHYYLKVARLRTLCRRMES